MFACQNGHPDIVIMLLDIPKCRVDIKDKVKLIMQCNNWNDHVHELVITWHTHNYENICDVHERSVHVVTLNT